MLPQMDYVIDVQKYYYSPAIFTYAILWAPISEEILSRGIIFTVAQKNMGMFMLLQYLHSYLH